MKSSTATPLAAFATLLFSTASAQQTYTIDPNSVSNATRSQWCTDEVAQCPAICLQTAAASSETQSNACDPTTLTYSCICADGNSPNLTVFSQTMPYFICTEWGNQCVANCGTNNTCSAACRDDHPCGAQNTVRVNSSTITSSHSSTASGGSSSTAMTGATTTASETVYSGLVGASSSSTGKSSSATSSASSAASIRTAALNAGQAFGLLGVVGAMVGGFAWLL